MNIILPFGDRTRATALLPVALDASGNPQAFTGTLSIDDYATCYVAKDSTKIYVAVKSSPGIGQVKTVNLTVQTQDLNGNPLPPFSQAFDVYGPPAPPLATHLQVPITFNVTTGVSSPPDPGAPSVQLP